MEIERGEGLTKQNQLRLQQQTISWLGIEDDLIEKASLKYLNNNDEPYTGAISSKFENGKNKIIGQRKARDLLSVNDVLKSCDIGLSTVMIKKTLLKNRYFAKLKTKEDYILWLKLAKKKNVFYAIKKSLTSWRSLENSLSSSIIQKLFDGYFVYRNFLKQSVFKSLFSLFILSINFLRK